MQSSRLIRNLFNFIKPTEVFDKSRLLSSCKTVYKINEVQYKSFSLKKVHSSQIWNNSYKWNVSSHFRGFATESSSEATKVEDVDKIESSSEDQEKKWVARLTGLPFSTQEDEIETFLDGVKVKNVHIQKYRNGRNSGIAYVEVETEEDLSQALKFDRETIGERYVLINEYVPKEKMEKKNTEEKHINGDTREITLTGVPLHSTKNDVLKFMENVEVHNIEFHKKPNGSTTGTVYVTIPSSQLNEALHKDFNFIRNRFVRVRSQTQRKEFKEVERSSPPQDTGTGDRTIVYLRGLPFESEKEDIIKFLEDVNIIDVEFKESRSGKRQGTAQVTVATPIDVEKALKKHKMFIGERYIEVFDRNPKIFLH